MKLQLAIDHGLEDQVLSVVEKLSPVVDIIEIGFPMVVTFGLRLVEEVRALAPTSTICVDVKVFHGGTGVTTRCFDAGANIVTVLSGAPDPVIRKMVEKSRVHGGQIMCDMVAPPRKVAQRTAEVDDLGVDYVMVSTGFEPEYDYDIDKPRRWSFRPRVKPLDLAGAVKRNLRNAKLALHTGIDESNIRQILELEPEIVIVGRAILDTDDWVAAATRLERYLPYEG
jgi:3-keto-L-gulonate-6-phosphate decarboxylase